MIDSDVIFIIGGGPSARGLDFDTLKGKGFILAVNDSFLHAPYDAVVSMDGRWMFNRHKQLRDAESRLFASEKHFRKWCGAGWLWPGVSLHPVEPMKSGMSPYPEVLYAKHSGAMALNIAYLSQPKQVYLFGFDHTGDTKGEHWYANYPWRPVKKSFESMKPWIEDHAHAAKQFERAGIEVFNVSNISKIPDYRRIKYGDIAHHLKGIRQA